MSKEVDPMEQPLPGSASVAKEVVEVEAPVVENTNGNEEVGGVEVGAEQVGAAEAAKEPSSATEKSEEPCVDQSEAVQTSKEDEAQEEDEKNEVGEPAEVKKSEVLSFDDQPIPTMTSGAVDIMELPLGGSAGSMAGAFAENQEKPEDPQDARSLEQRLGDKAWKTRMLAYTELNTDGTMDPVQVVGWLPALVGDSNASALDAGLDAAVSFMQTRMEGDNVADIEAALASATDAICRNVVDKAFAARSSTQSKGQAVLLKLMEVTSDTTVAIQALMTRLSDKKVKIPPMCLDTVREAVVAFGVHALPVKDMIALLKAPLADMKVAATREAAMALVVELHRWTGRMPLKAVLDTMKSAQQTEFEKLVAKADAVIGPVPTVYLRKQRPSVEERAARAAASAVDEDVRGLDGTSTVDPKDFMDEVDLTRVLRGDFAKLIKEEKWSDQLSALTSVLDAIGPLPKLKAGIDLTGLFDPIKTILRNPTAHVQLLLAVMKILGALSEGLPGDRDLASQVRPCVQYIVLKCKDRKLCAEVSSCLGKLVMHCIAFESLSEDVHEILTNKKSPSHARMTLLDFLKHVLASPTGISRIGTDALKTSAEAVVAVTSDGDPKVRENACATLCVLYAAAKSQGKTADSTIHVLKALEHSNNKVYKRMISGPPADDTSAMGKQKDTTSDKPAKIAKNASAPPSSSSSSSKATAPAEEPDDTPQELALSEDEVIEKLGELQLSGWSTSMQEAVDSTKWQDKVEVFEALASAISEKSKPELAPHVISYLKIKTNGFKMSNMNVTKAVLASCEKVSVAAGTSLDKATVWTVMRGAVGPKLADTKLTGQLTAVLVALGASVGVSFVAKRLMALLTDAKVKAPAAILLVLEWLLLSTKSMGANRLPLANMFSFVGAEALGNKMAAVRKAGMDLLCTCYHQLGPKINALVSKIPEALRVAVTAEFDKTGYDPSISASIRASAPTEASGGDDEGEAGLERQDLATLVSKTLLMDLSNIEGKSSWQGRKTAIEAVAGACDSSGFNLQANKFATDVARALRSRMAKDTQANLKPIAAGALGKLLASVPVEPGCRMLRLVAQAWIGGLAENKKSMRDATAASLQMMVTRQPTSIQAQGERAPAADPSYLGCVIGPIAEGLANPVGRSELLEWFLPHVGAIKTTHDCSDLVPALVLALQDKIASVRVLAEKVLIGLGGRGLMSAQHFDRATRDLSPAAIRSLKGVIVKVFDAINGTEPSVLQADGTTLTSSRASLDSTTSSPPPRTSRLSRSQASPASAKEKSPVRASPMRARNSKKDKDKEDAPTGAAVDAPVGPPLRKTNKMKRLEEFFKLNWPQPPAEAGPNDFGALKNQWESLLSVDMREKLFPERKSSVANLSMSMDEALGGVSALTEVLDNAIFVQHIDLVFRWVCCVLAFRETSTGLLRVLSFVEAVLSKCRDDGVVLHESEVMSLIPHIVERSGHKSERHRAAYMAVIGMVAEVMAPNRLCQLLLQGLGCKNKKTRVVCLQEIRRVVESAGNGVLGRAGMREVGAFLDSKDSDVAGRSACLDLCYAIFAATGNDMGKLLKSLGNLSDRSQSIVEDRIKQKLKNGPGSSTLSAAPGAGGSGTKLSIRVEATSPADASPLVPKPAEVNSPEVNPFQLQMTPPGTEAKVGNRTKTNMKSIRFAGAPPTPILWGSNDELEFSFNLDRRGTLGGDAAGQIRPARSSGADELLAGLPMVEGRVSLTDDGEDASPLELRPPSPPDVFDEILSAVDALLACDTRVASTDDVQQNARESIKALHSVITASVESNAPALQGPRSSWVVSRITAVLRRSFEFPCSDMDVPVDLPLASVSLAVLFACIRSNGGAVIKSISTVCLEDMVEECLRRIVDPSLTESSSENSAYGLLSDGEQILKAINLILISLGSTAHPVLVVGVLLRVLRCCVPEIRHAPKPPMPPGASRPSSRLLHKVLKNVDSNSPLFDSDHLPQVMLHLHHFFEGHPSETVCPEPFSAAKALLEAVLRAHGADTLLEALQALWTTGEIPRVAAVTKLVCRLSSRPVPQWSDCADTGGSDENDSDGVNSNSVPPVASTVRDTSSPHKPHGLPDVTMAATVPPRSVSKSAEFTPRSLARRTTLGVSSPRAMLSNKVMGSLNSLSASLDLPSAGSDGDSDLAARLSRLKQMNRNM